MSATSCRKPPDFDAIKPYLRELGALFLAWANAQDRLFPDAAASAIPLISTTDYLGNYHYCPACGDWQTEGGSVSIEEGLALQQVSCLNCNATWRDVYVLSGFDDLDLPTAGS